MAEEIGKIGWIDMTVENAADSVHRTVLRDRRSKWRCRRAVSALT